MSEPAISIRSLSHSYGTRSVLDGLSVDVVGGSMVALLGPNGSGKTTLFRILSTLIPPATGQVRVLGNDVIAERDAVRRQLGVVFQSPSLDRMLSAEENLRYHGRLYGLTGRELADRIDEMLARFAIADRRRERVDRLSGGLRRRVELAKGLLTRPSILLLDEPSTGLDPVAQHDLWQQLRRVRNDGVTVLLTTHHMQEADAADRVLILNAGNLVADGSPDELKSRIGGDVVTIATDHPDDVACLIRGKLGIDARADGSTVRFTTPEARDIAVPLLELVGPQARSIAIGKPSLQDVFAQATGQSLNSIDA